MRAQFLWLDGFVAICSAFIICGCAAPRGGGETTIDLERVFTSRGALFKEYAWLAQYVAVAPAGVLITVDSTVGSSEGTVLERRRVDNSVVCDKLWSGDGQIQRKRKYSFLDPAACETFEALRRAISSSDDFVLPGYDVTAAPRFATCLIVTDRSARVLYVEGGVLRTQTALRQLQIWQEKLDAKESIEDGDMARGLLGAGTLAHDSILLVIAVDAFDQICEIGSGAAGAARGAPGSAGR